MKTEDGAIKGNDQSNGHVDGYETKSKVDPSFKSKRYRDKLRTEIKALELLLPIERTSLSRKLDSQTVFRLVIAYFRSKIFFKGLYDKVKYDPTSGAVEPGKKSDDVIKQMIEQGPDGVTATQLLDGFLLVVTSDGTVLFVSESILQYLGYNQVDLMHRCIYGVIHPDDQQEVKVILEHTFGPLQLQSTAEEYSDTSVNEKKEKTDTCKSVSFLCRMKCFNGTSAGYLKMHCSGTIKHVQELATSNRTSCQVLFLLCHPFMINTVEVDQQLKQNVFWSKHDLALSIREVDKTVASVLGHDCSELEGRSFYSLVHPEDLATLASCHRTLTESSEVQTLYFRLEKKDGGWVWVHSRSKVICKNSKKFSIVFSHCPVREEDSTYIQQEATLRQRYAINDLMCMSQTSQFRTWWKDFHNCVDMDTSLRGGHSDSHEDPQSSLVCPSSWHALTDRHSPILPSSQVAHKISQREKHFQYQEFKRRQQVNLEQGTSAKNLQELWEEQGYGDHHDAIHRSNDVEAEQFPYMGSLQDLTAWHQAADISQTIGLQFGLYRHPMEDAYHMQPSLFQEDYYSQMYPMAFQGPSPPVYSHPPPTHMPPSPPPSPPAYHNPHGHGFLYQPEVHAINRNCQYRRADDGPRHVTSSEIRESRPSTSIDAPLSCVYQQYNCNTPFLKNLQNITDIHIQRQQYEVDKSHRKRPRIDPNNHRKNMTFAESEPLVDIKPTRLGQMPKSHETALERMSLQIKPSTTANRSCEFEQNRQRCHMQNSERNQSGLDTIGHMMIVEQGQTFHSKGCVDLPSIGSFLEYLNETW